MPNPLEAPDRRESHWVRDLYRRRATILDTYSPRAARRRRPLWACLIHLERSRGRPLLGGRRGPDPLPPPPTTRSSASWAVRFSPLAKAHCPWSGEQDTGGGSSFSMLRTMAAADEVAKLGRAPCCTGRNLLWLGHPPDQPRRYIWPTRWTARGRDGGGFGRARDLASTAGDRATPMPKPKHLGAVFPTIHDGGDRAVGGFGLPGQRALSLLSPICWVPANPGAPWFLTLRAGFFTGSLFWSVKAMGKRAPR